MYHQRHGISTVINAAPSRCSSLAQRTGSSNLNRAALARSVCAITDDKRVLRMRTRAAHNAAPSRRVARSSVLLRRARRAAVAALARAAPQISIVGNRISACSSSRVSS